MPERSRKSNLIGKLRINQKGRIALVCLCISGFLWLFVSLGKSYQYTYSIALHFVNENQPGQKIDCNDSIIDVHLTSSGFNWLTSRISSRHLKTLQVDVNSLSLNTRSGSAKVPTGFLNSRILSEIGMEKVPIEIMPDTIVLRWQKTYSKRVPLISRVNVECRQPFGLSAEPELLEKYIEVEGSEEVLEKIDTIFTKSQTLSGINHNLLTFVPIDFAPEESDVNIQMSSVGLKIQVKEYTENTITIPVEAIVGKNESVKLFPSSVKLRYKVAMEDYKKVDTDGITAYVMTAVGKGKRKLRVMLNNVPSYIKVMSIDPPKVDYIIRK